MYCMPACNPLDVYGGMGLPRVFPVSSIVDALTDTFLMPDRQYFFPQLMTQSGTWAWFGSSNNLFGGYLYNSSNASGNYLETLEEITLLPGTYRISALADRYNSGCLAEVYFAGVDMEAPLDFWNATLLRNQIVTNTFVVETKTTGFLKILATDGGTDAFVIPVQQFELVKTSAESNLGTSLDDLPWHGHCPAFSIYSAEYNNSGWTDYKSTIVPAQTTSAQWGSYIQIGHGTYAWRVKYRFWAPQGTHTLNLRHLTSTSGGTITATVNGGATTPSTFSTSAGATNYNVSTNLTFTAATTGIQEIEFSGSGGVTFSPQWISWRKTSALGAITATGATYGVESAELWQHFRDDHANITLWDLSSNYLYYGVNYNSGTINDYLEWAIGILSGTYDVNLVTHTGANRGIAHLSLDGGADLGTVDLYAASSTYNQRKAFSSVALSPGDLRVSMDSKNPSGGYRNATSFYRLLRTGD